MREGPARRLGVRLVLLGAALLLGSLFLTWSHQFSPAFLARWGSSDALRGVPRDPDAWQVYSVVDVLLALLAGALILVARQGTRRALGWSAAGAAVGLAFTFHALAVPPTDGANIFDSSLRVPAYAPNSPAAGPGETVAILGLLVAAVGLAMAARKPGG